MVNDDSRVDCTRENLGWLNFWDVVVTCLGGWAGGGRLIGLLNCAVRGFEWLIFEKVLW